MKTILLPLVCALLPALCCFDAWAQDNETMQMPSRAVFVDEQCVPAMSRVTVRGDEAARLSFATAACECSYRLLAPHQEVSRRMFDDAGVLCRAEFETDPSSFMDRYRKTAAQP